MADLELYYEMRNIIKAGNLEKMKQIINNYGLSYCSAWDDGYKLLTEACVQNHSHLAEYLLSKNAKINCDYDLMSPLQAAVMNNNKKLIKLLLEHGAKAYTNRNNGPLQIAIKNKSFEIAKLLSIMLLIKAFMNYPIPRKIQRYIWLFLAVNTQCDSKGSKSIHLAIRLRLLSIVQLLLEFDADVNAKTKEGYTPLFLTLFLSQIRFTDDEIPVSSEQDSKILNLLLDYNVDINIVDRHNHAILYYANTFTHEHFIPIVWDISYEHD
ncbi:hypothetical protein KQX54_009583 [Cotesia glomerata]|uniref:Ankyrin repeat protein n=1 Tax=Cotesia glomerata TaxID=32391 RepID=A0AAV7IMC5_COTGL|nr:hypothetical protein KQX54_009583 [Cotesia glomerata]